MLKFARESSRRCLPVNEWPASDRAAWAAAHRRGGLLDEDGRAASWRPATTAFVASGYGRFLSAQKEIGVLDEDMKPEDRVTRARVQEYFAYLNERNHPSTVAMRIGQLARCISAIAPLVDWTWLRRIAVRLRRTAPRARDDRLRLVPATVLRDLGFSLMHRAETNIKLSDLRRALLFRDGLIIWILLASALRASNFAALSVGTSLQRRGKTWWVTFTAEEMKNERPFELPLPTAYTGAIERYLGHYRSQLVGCPGFPVEGQPVWVTNCGRPLTASRLGVRTRIVTERELGRGLNPHLFRKLVRTELTIRDPEHVGVAQPMLAHASYRTTQDDYNLGRAIDAARRHHAMIQSIRTTATAGKRPVVDHGRDKDRRSGQRTRAEPVRVAADSRDAFCGERPVGVR